MKVSKEQFVERREDGIKAVKFRPPWKEIEEQVREQAEIDYDRLRQAGFILVDEAKLRQWIEDNTRRTRDGSIFSQHPCVKFAKKFLGEG